MSESKLDDSCLLLGLNALARAHERNYFADGHRGGAIISAFFFCRDVDIEEGVDDLIASRIREEYLPTGLCDPFPDEAPAPPMIEDVAAALRRSIGRLRQAGHNVILGSLALKALRQLPQALTPARARGICKLIEAFEISDVPLDAAQVPELAETPPAAEFILAELLKCIQAFDGRGQGWSGHLTTYGRALHDLHELGFDEIVASDTGFEEYIRRIRLGPQETDKPRAEHLSTALMPHQRAYWEQRSTGPLGLGHSLKYPYGFYGLMQQAQNSYLKQQCNNAAYHIF